MSPWEVGLTAFSVACVVLGAWGHGVRFGCGLERRRWQCARAEELYLRYQQEEAASNVVRLAEVRDAREHESGAEDPDEAG